MDNFEPIDVDFIINSEEVKRDAARVKEEITGVAVTAEQVTERTSKKVREELSQTTKTVKEETVTATKETQKLNQELEKSAANLGNQGKAATQAKAQWNGLGNSISQIGRELPAFTYSAQTGFMAVANNIPILVDEIARLRAANSAAAASGAATIPIWKAIGAAIFSWGTIISLAITLVTVYGKEIGNFIKGLFSFKDAADEAARAQGAMSEAFKSSEVASAIEGVIDLKTNLQLAKDGMIDKKTVIDQYNESIGKTTTLATTLAEVEDGIAKNADNYVKATLYKAAAEVSRKEAAEKMLELIKEQNRIEEELTKAPEKIANASTFTSGTIGGNIFSDKQIQIQAEKDLNKAKEDNLKLQEKELENANKIDKVFKDKIADLGIEFDKPSGVEKASNSILNARQQLLDKIAAIDAEYARKSFSKDEEELQALRDKFGKVRDLVERFNADPKNNAKRIDLTGLDATENQAVADLSFRQETDRMAKEITKQKQLFQEFEAYKVQFGAEKAKEAYGEQIGAYESYMDYLRGLIDNNQDTYSAITLGKASGGQTERYKLLEKEAEAANEVNEKINQKILAENQTFQNRLQVMEDNYQAARLRLIEQGKYDEAEVLRVKHEEEVGKLSDAQLQKTEAYKNFFRNVQRMTVANARVLIAEMDEEIKHHQGSAEELAKIEERKARLLRLIRRQSLEDISKITGALGGLGQSLSELGDATGRGGLAEIGGLMSGLASGVNDLLVAFDDDASQADVIAAGINGIVKMVDMLAGAARRRREAEEEYYRSVIGFQNDYNLSLNEQIRLQSILGESVFLKDYEGRMKDGVSAAMDAAKKYQDAMAALSGAQVKSGQKNAIDWGNVGKGAGAGAAAGAAIGSVVPVIGTAIGAIAGAITGAFAGLFGGKKKKDTFLPLLQEYPELLQQSEDGITRINRELAENLIQNNLVDEKTKDILQNILDWDDALEEARKQIRDVVSELAGSLGGDMRNALVQAFRDGEDAAKAMGKTVEKVLEDILSQLIFNRIFAKAFKDLEEEMIASQDVGGDGNWVDDFERFFKTSQALGEQWEQAMKDAQAQAAASGFNIFNPDSSPAKKEGLTGGIQRITEETGQELAGLFRGFYDITKRSFQLSEARYSLEQRHYESIIQMLMIMAKIEQHTGQTVLEMQSAVVELKKIAKNTKSGQSSWDLGLGND